VAVLPANACPQLTPAGRRRRTLAETDKHESDVDAVLWLASVVNIGRERLDAAAEWQRV
jgi:hypothetical protein